MADPAEMYADHGDPLVITASGGFCAPEYGEFRPLQRGDIYYITYRVKGRLRRRWLRWWGWSTEWTVEYEYVPPTDSLRFTATRGGIEF